VLLQAEEDHPPPEWSDLCITSRYQSDFDHNDPVRLDDEWLSSDELDFHRHQDAQHRVVPPPSIVEPSVERLTQPVVDRPSTLGNVV